MSFARSFSLLSLATFVFFAAAPSAALAEEETKTPRGSFAQEPQPLVELEPRLGHQLGQTRPTMLAREQGSFATATLYHRDVWSISGFLAGGAASMTWRDGPYTTRLSLTAQWLLGEPWGKGQTSMENKASARFGGAVEELGDHSFQVGGRGLLVDARWLMGGPSQTPTGAQGYSEIIFGYRLAFHDLEARFGGGARSPDLFHAPERHQAFHHVLYSGMSKQTDLSDRLCLLSDMTTGVLIAWAKDGDGTPAENFGEIGSFGDTLLRRRSYGLAFTVSLSPRWHLGSPQTRPKGLSVGLDAHGELRWAFFGSISGDSTNAFWSTEEAQHRSTTFSGGITAVAALGF